MINTLKIFEELKKSMEPSAAKSIAETLGGIYEDLQSIVTKEDFHELKEVVKELAEAQNRTEKKIEELAEAQNRTEKKLEELAEAQNRTEKKLEELAEAQKKTEKEVFHLSKRLKNVEKNLGGISNTIGYELEDLFYPFFPSIFQEDFGVQITGHVKRTFIEYPDGRDDEVNILARGILNDKSVYVIGESKAQIGKNDIKSFSKLIHRVKQHFQADILPVILCYMIHPEVERYVQSAFPEIKIYKSFELKLRIRELGEFN